MEFHVFFGIDYRIDFFIDFWWKMGPKWYLKMLLRLAFLATFSKPFRDRVFYIDFMLNLVTIWLPFWLQFAPFWRPLASFGRPFGLFWLPFGSLGLTFGDPGGRFSHFWRFLLSFLIFSRIFIKKWCKIMLFLKIRSASRIVGKPNRVIPKKWRT